MILPKIEVEYVTLEKGWLEKQYAKIRLDVIDMALETILERKAFSPEAEQNLKDIVYGARWKEVEKKL